MIPLSNNIHYYIRYVSRLLSSTHERKKPRLTRTTCYENRTNGYLRFTRNGNRRRLSAPTDSYTAFLCV